MIEAHRALSRRSAPWAYSSAVRRRAASSMSRSTSWVVHGITRSERECGYGAPQWLPRRAPSGPGRPSASARERPRAGAGTARARGSPRRRAGCSSPQGYAPRTARRRWPRCRAVARQNSSTWARRRSCPARSCRARSAAPRKGWPWAGSTMVSGGKRGQPLERGEEVGERVGRARPRVEADVARDARQQLVAADHQLRLVASAGTRDPRRARNAATPATGRAAPRCARPRRWACLRRAGRW